MQALWSSLEELMIHSPDFSRRLLRVRLFCMAVVEQLEYGVVCAAQLLPLTDVAQPVLCGI